MFNTEYNSNDETMRVIDAVAQFSFSGGTHNLWVGRFLPPSDRANLYGPYYASNWAVYQDGVQDGYPFETEGRDDGVAYWGQFDKVKVSVGAFDVSGLTTGDSDVLLRGRVQWTSGTRKTATTSTAPTTARRTCWPSASPRRPRRGRGLFVRLPAGEEARQLGVVTVESEYALYDGSAAIPRRWALVLREDRRLVPARRLPVPGLGQGQVPGAGQVRPGHLRLWPRRPRPGHAGVDLNYLIKTFNARVSLYYLDKSFDPDIGARSQTIGLGLQVQM
jgi:hypothetical protein